LQARILHQPSISILFDSENESKYFSLFCDEIASGLSPYFDPEPWRRMILQACSTEPSILSVAVAIGALGKTYSTNRSVEENGYFELRSPPEANQDAGSQDEMVKESFMHHQNALRQYQKALRRLREDISSGRLNLRATLISCVAIVCFEELQGNHESVRTHLASGINVMQEWKRKQREERKHPLGFSSPAPDVVEDFLVQTFGRLEIQAMSQIDTRPPEYHRALKSQGKETIKNMPETLKAVEEARVYLDLIMRRAMHYMASVIFSGNSYTDTKSGTQGTYGRVSSQLFLSSFRLCALLADCSAA
jgi:hypothetical protein